MLNGQGITSFRKQELADQRIPSVGFVKFKFAHKCTGGETGINLNSLTTPPEMSANGFVNPNASTLTGASLLFFRNNLKLVSSSRGDLVDYLSYTVASSTQINFVGFTASAGEIFIGTVDYNAQTGITVANTVSQPVTYTLPASQVTVNLGQGFPVNKFSASNIGAVTVYKDGILQNRNTGNSSVTLDGNYYEVDNGSGNFSTIQFNVAETYSTTIDILPTGFIIEQNNGSLQSTIEAVQGQVNNMATYVAALSGNSTTTVLGAAPSNVDLTTFGNKVLTLQQTSANITTSNVWTAIQNFPGYTGTTTASAGNIGEIITASGSGGGTGSALVNATAAFQAATYVLNLGTTVTPGWWLIQVEAECVNTPSNATWSPTYSYNVPAGLTIVGLSDGNDYLVSAASVTNVQTGSILLLANVTSPFSTWTHVFQSNTFKTTPTGSCTMAIYANYFFAMRIR